MKWFFLSSVVGALAVTSFSGLQIVQAQAPGSASSTKPRTTVQKPVSLSPDSKEKIQAAVANGFQQMTKLAESKPAPSAKADEKQTHLVVLRIPQKALDPLVNRSIDVRGNVDKMVLGAHVVGQSHTTGKVGIKTVGNCEDASLKVTFEGQTTAFNVGYQGPAVVHNHTITNFSCTRKIVFDPEKGFVAEPCQITCDTQLVYDSIDSTRGGLMGRLVRRVANRRAGESHGEALAIAKRDNAKEVQEQFDANLDKQLVQTNRQLRIVSMAKSLFGNEAKLQVGASSEEGCFNLGIAYAGNTNKMPVLPPLSRDDGQLEVWVHPSVFGPTTESFIKTANYLQMGAFLVTDKVDLLKTLVLANERASQMVDVTVSNEWLVFTMGPGMNNKLAASQVSLQKRAP